MAKASAKKGFWHRAWRMIKRVFIILLIAQLVYIIALRWIDPPITLTQLDSWISGNGLKRDYVSGKNISPNAKLAVIASEDQLFPDHSGFDWKSIERAQKNNERRPKKIKGASTISQQVAKNVFLWQGRSWIRKGLEVYFTFMIELIWNKERILEMYLNVAEMGKGVFGIEAASQYYYKKSCKNLSRHEAAMIAACLPNPKRYTIQPLSGYVAARSSRILQQMNNLDGDPEIQKIIDPL